MITFNGISVNENDYVRLGNWVSKHFKYREFQSKDGHKTVKMSSKTIQLLDELRVWLNTPIVITSAYRSPKHNASVGGAKNSQHTLGTAVDIQVKGYTPIEVAAYGQALGFTGIGLYNTFTHLDTRPNKSRWGDYKGQTNLNNIKLKEKGGANLNKADLNIKVHDKDRAVKGVVERDLKGNPTNYIPVSFLRELGYEITGKGTNITLTYKK